MKTTIYDIKTLQTDGKTLANVLSELRFVLNKCNVNRLLSFLNTLRDDLMVGVETDYVDAMYRDEYYRFYATKLHRYDRNCLKFTFFKPGHLVAGGAVDYSHSDEIINDFVGFLVVRPLTACIGRNVISPEARKPGLPIVRICRSKVNTTALGLKVSVEGFPHASQDSEMMACAETSLWSIAEYYGHKYSEYKLVRPSDILEAMRPHSYHRQLPTEGLTFEQISVGLIRFGFSTQVYSLYRYDNNSGGPHMLPEMKEVLACYIESGFPLALCLRGQEIGHAVTCVGRPKIDRSGTLVQETTDGKNLLVWNKSIDQIILNDDNMPPYQLANIDHPTTYYNNKKWDDVLLKMFMVPLPAKVYMDAFIAIPLSKKITVKILGAQDRSVIRTYLASSRSFRNHIAQSGIMTNNNKELLLSMNLPKFVWVSEIADVGDFQNKIAGGLIVLDATEPTQTIDIPLLLAVLNSNGFIYQKNKFKKLSLADPLKLESYNKNIR